MSQHDYDLANLAGAAHRADLNNALAAIVSQNSGATEPATPYAYQWWVDTTTGTMKQRNAANSAWITLMTLSSGLMAANAALAGSASQVFSVATPTNAAHAVRADGIRNDNRFINPGMSVQQYTNGAVALSTSRQYGIDRFFSTYSGLTGVTAGMSQNSGWNESTKTGCAFWTSVTASSGTGLIFQGQLIEAENVRDLGGRTVPVRIKVYHDIGTTTNFTVYCYKANALNDFSGLTSIGSFTGDIPSGAWTYLEGTITLGATDCRTGLLFQLANTSNLNWSGKNLQTSEWQLSANAVMPPFEPRPYAQELELCQWYYERMLATAAGERFAEGFFDSTTAVASTLNFKPKRIAPSISFSTATNFQARYSGGLSAACSAISASAINKYGKAAVSGTVSVGSGVVGQGCLITAVNSNADIVISAELP